MQTTLYPARTGDARWTAEQAHSWYNQQPYMYGANYITSDASNQIDMWQDATFNPDLIEREMGFMHGTGMNVARVFLHDRVWEADPAGFKRNVDMYLAIADSYNIRTLLVFFDSVWNPAAHLGPQPDVTAGLHNGGWVQSPGYATMSDPSRYGHLQNYVEDITATFARDKRVLGWDIWNEPDNLNNGSYNESPEKWDYVNPLLKDSFQWARRSRPDQFLTSGVWIHYRDNFDSLHPIFKTQLTESDIISFHDYTKPEVFADNVRHLQETYGRPVICTEYMARDLDSRFETHLPIALDNKVGMFNWGFVKGKSNTHCDWLSWERHHVGETCREPDTWFHDVVDAQGDFHNPGEEKFFKEFKVASQLKQTAAGLWVPH